MKEISFSGQKVLVLGLAKSGYEAAKLLHQLGAEVTVNDGKDLTLDAHARQLAALGINVVDQGHPLTLLNGVNLIVKNPGIPYHIELLQEAKARNIKIITEVELAYLIHEGETIAITGTNGKTTTTSLLGEMFAQSSKKGRLSGNIGYVATEVAQQTTPDEVMITELSSFQLMGISAYHPHIAVITNIYSAHLDYHASLDEYQQAKLDIAKNQTAEDFLVFNHKQKEFLTGKDIKSQIIYFGFEKNNGAYVQDGMIYFQDKPLMRADEVALPGPHNMENVLAAVCVAKLMELEDAAIINALKTFTGIKHRLQFVTEKNGVKYYNDSKATNTLAASFALDAFQAPVHWLAGGLDRGNGFDDLKDKVAHVKQMYVFGETADKLIDFAQRQDIPVVRCNDVTDAANQAMKRAEPSDVVLLSPACASWDQYENFEVRGDAFIEAVKKD